MEEFWGVDDPEERNRLREKALRRDPFANRAATTLGILGTVAVITALGTIWLSEVPGLDFNELPAILCGGLSAWAVMSWQKWRVRENMRCVLRSEGRCERCGYKLFGKTVSNCPECGGEQGQEKVT